VTGPVWTVASPHQETAAEIHHYRDEGVAGVEMEAAAKFTVGAVGGAAVAATFAIR
jgi:uridine phosphorylase